MEPTPKQDRRGKILLLFAILTTVMLVGSVAYYYLQSGTSKIVYNNSSSTSVYSQSTGLQLMLNLGNLTITAGQSEEINFEVYNALDFMNSVNVERNYPAIPVSAGPCSDQPFGIAVIFGNYSANNLWSANPLQIFEPGTYFCPAEFPISQYQFFAHSSKAKVFSNVTSLPPGMTETLDKNLNLSGYWNGNSNAHEFFTFPAGIYTVVAADGWGQLVLLHFQVKN